MTDTKDWITAQPPLLSEQTETPPQETGGDVERVRELVFKMLAEGTEYADVPYVELQRPRYQYLLQRVDYFSGLLAAMRPVVDREKLSEIRARHEKEDARRPHGTTWVWDNAKQAHADRAFLLSALDGVSHDAD